MTHAFWKPSRELRRRQSGRPCPGCGLTLHHRDVIAYAGATTTYFLHAACADVLAEQAAAASGAEEDAPETAAAAEHGETLDAGKSIVPDCEVTATDTPYDQYREAE